jgi:hypothetical protein
MKNYVAIHRGGQKTLVYHKHERVGRTIAKKTIPSVYTNLSSSPFPAFTGIEGNLVRLKNTTAEILIGENYKAELMEIIRGKMIQ